MQTTLTIPGKTADKYGKIQPADVRDDVLHDEEALADDDYEACDCEDDDCDCGCEASGDGYYQTAEEFLEELREAIHEVKEDIAGRKKLRTYEEFKAELQGQALE